MTILPFSLSTTLGFLGSTVRAEMSELENFIRARIAIGEAMSTYMRNLGSKGGYNPGSGGPDMEQMGKMEEEINAMVSLILETYDLTINEYNQRSTEVFSDKDALKAFLEAHPDLKERYEVLPLHRSRPPGGPS